MGKSCSNHLLAGVAREILEHPMSSDRRPPELRPEPCDFAVVISTTHGFNAVALRDCQVVEKREFRRALHDTSLALLHSSPAATVSHRGRSCR